MSDIFNTMAALFCAGAFIYTVWLIWPLLCEAHALRRRRR